MKNLATYFILFASIYIKGTWSIKLDHESLKEVGIESRIIRGDETTIEQHPYQAFLRASDFRVACSGAILTSHHIVTTALCVDKADFVNVRIGSVHKYENGHQYTSKTYMVHPMYLAGEPDFDVAILLIKEGMPLDGETVDTIDLVPLNYDPPTGKKMTISGWGEIGPGGSYESTVTLLETDLYAVSTYECGNGNPDITERLFCLIDREDQRHTCNGDMGDPVVDEDGLLAGVVSLYIICTPSKLQPATRFGEPQIRSFLMAMTTTV